MTMPFNVCQVRLCKTMQGETSCGLFVYLEKVVYKILPEDCLNSFWTIHTVLG